MKKISILNIFLILVWFGLFCTRLVLKLIPNDILNFTIFTFYTLVTGMIIGFDIPTWLNHKTDNDDER